MKRIVAYFLLMTGALLTPTRGTDVGRLKPVEVVSLYMQQEKIIVETDTEDKGEGKTVEAAIRDLKETTAGLIFLDTADYFLVTQEGKDCIPEIRKYLKDSVRVCAADYTIKLRDAAQYLSVHKPKITLKEWNDSSQLQILEVWDGRMHLIE